MADPTLPEDPKDYQVPLTDDGRWRLVRTRDGAEVGVYDTKAEAVAAADADRDA